MMDFQDVELPTLVKFISEITGRNFLMDDKVQGRVSVVSPNEITVEEAYQVFQSVLQVKGFTLVDAGPVTKIIPSKDAKEADLPVSTDYADADVFVTRIVPLMHVAADSATSLLQPLVSRDGLISAYAPTNSLIVIDTGANISRLLQIIHQLDVPGQERTVEVIHLQHAYAGELADILRDAVEDQNAPNRPTRPGTAVSAVTTGARRATAGEAATLKIVPDERSNTIVVIGSPFEIRQVHALIAKLDQPLPRGNSRVKVYPLRYADAVELVQVLGDLLGISVSTPIRQALPGRSVTEGGGRFGSRSNNSLGGEAFGRGVLGGQSAGSLGGIGNRQQAVLGGGGSQQAPTGAGTPGGGLQLEGEVRVTADPATNSLVIAAAPQDFETLREVIDRLDVPRRQVLVEAIIFEITLNRAKELGIELQGGTTVNGKSVLFGRTSFQNLDPITQAFATGDTTALAGIPGLLSALVSDQNIVLADGTEIPAGIALVSALASSSDINVLSAPNILTSDDEEAEIVVGQNVPFVTSRSTNQTNLENTFSQIDRRDVGITLRLTPQITEGNSVRLFVFQEVSALVPTSEAQVLQLGPTTSLRSATTTVVVQDGESVAIGGLINDRWTNTAQGVPYLMDVPVIGDLFRFDNKMKEKVNLIILLTPRIVHNPADMRALADKQRIRFHGVDDRRGRPLRRHARTPRADAPALEPGGDGRRPPSSGEPGGASGSVLMAAESANGHDALPDAAAASSLANRFGLEFRDSISPGDLDPALVARLPIQYARRCACLPLAERSDGAIEVALGDPRSAEVVDDLRALYQRRVVPIVVPAAAILDSINSAYDRAQGTAQAVMGDIEAGALDQVAHELEEPRDLLDAEDEAPIIRLVNSLLYQAVKERAATSTSSPSNASCACASASTACSTSRSSRCDALQASIVSRIKIMARLNIAEKRLPQDGRIRLKVAGRDIDVPLSTCRVAYGERVGDAPARPHRRAARPRAARASTGSNLDDSQRLIQRSHGIVLVTGPTGSGKTTTLYARARRGSTRPTRTSSRSRTRSRTSSQGVGQIQVNPKIEPDVRQRAALDPAPGPDVIMVGEIRDLETAEIAIQAALTGHLVFSTLHTNDAPSAITRLVDMGVEPFLVGSSLVGGARAAPRARAVPGLRGRHETTARQSSPSSASDLGDRAMLPHRPRAATGCNYAGYRGRIGIHELLQVDDEMRSSLMQPERDATSIKSAAVRPRHARRSATTGREGRRGRDLRRGDPAGHAGGRAARHRGGGRRRAAQLRPSDSNPGTDSRGSRQEAHLATSAIAAADASSLAVGSVRGARGRCRSAAPVACRSTRTRASRPRARTRGRPRRREPARRARPAAPRRHLPTEVAEGATRASGPRRRAASRSRCRGPRASERSTSRSLSRQLATLSRRGSRWSRRCARRRRAGRERRA